MPRARRPWTSSAVMVRPYSVASREPTMAASREGSRRIARFPVPRYQRARGAERPRASKPRGQYSSPGRRMPPPRRAMSARSLAGLASAARARQRSSPASRRRVGAAGTVGVEQFGDLLLLCGRCRAGVLADHPVGLDGPGDLHECGPGLVVGFDDVGEAGSRQGLGARGLVFHVRCSRYRASLSRPSGPVHRPRRRGVACVHPIVCREVNRLAVAGRGVWMSRVCAEWPPVWASGSGSGARGVAASRAGSSDRLWHVGVCAVNIACGSANG